MNAEEETILSALRILASRFQQRDVYAVADEVKDFLRLQAQGLDHEVFSVMFLDVHSRLIAYESMFRGTLSSTTVHPREVVKRALELRAAAVVLHHNHPSGVCTPSKADEALTETLKGALALVDVQVLDHVISSDAGVLSMAEADLL